jgi:hypothetical protein
MLQVAGDDRLDREPVHERLRAPAGQELLQRDRASELAIFRLQDASHPALTEQRERRKATSAGRKWRAAGGPVRHEAVDRVQHRPRKRGGVERRRSGVHANGIRDGVRRHGAC